MITATLIIFALKAAAWTAVLFVWYLFAMFIQRRRHQIREKSAFMYYAALVIVASGLVLDFAYNIFPATLMFLELPRWFDKDRPELTLSRRLQRIRKQGSGWRLMVADFVCERILNPFDPDMHHC